MKYKEFIVSSNDDGRRFDKIILRLFPSLSFSFIQKNIRNGFVRLNGIKSSPDSRVFTGDKISCGGIMAQQEISEQHNYTDIESETLNKSIVQQRISRIPVLFCNNDIVVYNKPYNIKVQSSFSGDFSLDSYTKDNYPPQDSLSFKTGPLHRLDRKTTGLVIFSQSLYGARAVTDAIASRQVKKRYLAIIQGHPIETELWEDYLESNDNKSDLFKTMCVSDNNSDTSKKAITFMKPFCYGTYPITNTNVTLAQFEITTGRKHQIRLQSSSHGYPLLGDTAYNGQKINEPQDFYLHAFSLEFLKPIGNAPSVFKAPLNENFCSMLEKCLMNNALRIII